MFVTSSGDCLDSIIHGLGFQISPRNGRSSVLISVAGAQRPNPDLFFLKGLRLGRTCKRGSHPLLFDTPNRTRRPSVPNKYAAGRVGRIAPKPITLPFSPALDHGQKAKGSYIRNAKFLFPLLFSVGNYTCVPSSSSHMFSLFFPHRENK